MRTWDNSILTHISVSKWSLPTSQGLLYLLLTSTESSELNWGWGGSQSQLDRVTSLQGEAQRVSHPHTNFDLGIADQRGQMTLLGAGDRLAASLPSLLDVRSTNSSSAKKTLLGT